MDVLTKEPCAVTDRDMATERASVGRQMIERLRVVLGGLAGIDAASYGIFLRTLDGLSREMDAEQAYRGVLKDAAYAALRADREQRGGEPAYDPTHVARDAAASTELADLAMGALRGAVSDARIDIASAAAAGERSVPEHPLEALADRLAATYPGRTLARWVLHALAALDDSADGGTR